MGSLGQKLLLPFRNRPLLAHVVRSALASRLSFVIVVLGPGSDRLREALPQDTRLGYARNERPELGRSGSIQAGLEAARAANPAVPGVLFLLGDQPLMPAALIDAVIAAAEEAEARGPAGAPLAVAATQGGGARATALEAKGNPVLFRKTLFDQLMTLTGDRGALELIEARWHEAARVPIEDPMTQIRIETPDDYARLLVLERDAGGGLRADL
jgi:molybdenum cofactor cytidylyltransferase